MSDLVFKCHGCSKHLAIDRSAVGKTVACTHCRRVLAVPDPVVAFRCPSCDWELSAPADLAGEELHCPNCDEMVSIPATARGNAGDGTAAGSDRRGLRLASKGSSRVEEVPIPARRQDEDPSLRKCPFCAERIMADAIKCRYCGEFLDGRGRAAQEVRDKAPSERPGSVATAVVLCWISLVSQAVDGIAGLLETASWLDHAVGLTGSLFSVALTWLLIVKINAGRRWARIVLFVLTLLESLFTCLSLYDATAFTVVYGVAVFVVDVVAVVLLFTPSANAWFRAERTG